MSSIVCALDRRGDIHDMSVMFRLESETGFDSNSHKYLRYWLGKGEEERQAVAETGVIPYEIF